MAKRKWKRPDIATAGKDNCVPHAISVMRLALGYKTGLPDGYKLKNRGLTQAEGLELIGLAFPNHHIIYMQTNLSWKSCYRVDETGSDYLFAWSYSQDGEEDGHIVIGRPSRTDDMVINWILAVSIERQW